MNRALVTLAGLLITISAAYAQQPEPRPRAPQAGSRPARQNRGGPNVDTLKGEKKARYLLRQLNLTEEQKKQADALVELYYRIEKHAGPRQAEKPHRRGPEGREGWGSGPPCGNQRGNPADGSGRHQ
jgi:hypothetical protein